MNPIETILLLHGGWISARQICLSSGLNERALRGEGSPLRFCSISGDLGYKHVKNASDAEIERFCARLRSHAREELNRAQVIEDLKRKVEEEKKQLALF